jgi:hypothetical protein
LGTFRHVSTAAPQKLRTTITRKQLASAGCRVRPCSWHRLGLWPTRYFACDEQLATNMSSSLMGIWVLHEYYGWAKEKTCHLRRVIQLRECADDWLIPLISALCSGRICSGCTLCSNIGSVSLCQVPTLWLRTLDLAREKICQERKITSNRLLHETCLSALCYLAPVLIASCQTVCRAPRDGLRKHVGKISAYMIDHRLQFLTVASCIYVSRRKIFHFLSVVSLRPIGLWSQATLSVHSAANSLAGGFIRRYGGAVNTSTWSIFSRQQNHA